jgi:hypothetical protein
LSQPRRDSVDPSGRSTAWNYPLRQSNPSTSLSELSHALRQIVSKVEPFPWVKYIRFKTPKQPFFLHCARKRCLRLKIRVFS